MNCNANEMHEMQKDIQIAKLSFYGKKPSDRLSNTQVNNVTIKKNRCKETPTQVFPFEYCEIFKKQLSLEQLWWLLLRFERKHFSERQFNVEFLLCYPFIFPVG